MVTQLLTNMWLVAVSGGRAAGDDESVEASSRYHVTLSTPKEVLIGRSQPRNIHTQTERLQSTMCIKESRVTLRVSP